MEKEVNYPRYAIFEVKGGVKRVESDKISIELPSLLVSTLRDDVDSIGTFSLDSSHELWDILAWGLEETFDDALLLSFLGFDHELVGKLITYDYLVNATI